MLNIPNNSSQFFTDHQQEFGSVLQEFTQIEQVCINPSVINQLDLQGKNIKDADLPTIKEALQTIYENYSYPFNLEITKIPFIPPNAKATLFYTAKAREVPLAAAAFNSRANNNVSAAFSASLQRSSSMTQATNLRVDEDSKLAEHLQQEFASSGLARHPSGSPLSAVTSAVSAAFPTVSAATGSSMQEDAEEYINVRNVQAKLVEIHTLYNNKNYSEASSLIKAVLKFCDKQTDKQKYQETEYLCFTILGDIYLEKDTGKEDLQDYPKATALYQYARRMTVLGQSPEKEKNLELIDAKLVGIEGKFVNSVVGTPYKIDPNVIAGYKKNLEDFRFSLKPRLNSIKDLGVENDELNEERLFERSKVVEAIYKDIRNFFISHEESNKGLLIKLIEHAKATLGPVPHQADYAIIGLGSMALGTMTPWSDIEFAILIQDGLDETKKKDVKDYFYKLTTLFHIHIINLGETELAAMAIKELNDFTQIEHDDWFWDKLIPNGVSFDAQRPIGCKTPLGRSGFSGHKNYDLICTPVELAKYQNEWAALEPTLQQLLLNTVLIDGSSKLIENDAVNSAVSNRLLNMYNQLLKEKLERKEINGLTYIQQKSLETLQKDTLTYDPIKIIQSEEGKLLDVKKEIYRYPDRVFVALSSYLGLYNLSQCDALRMLGKNNFYNIDIETKNSLLIAFGIACELRLSTYCNNSGQNGQLFAFQSSYVENANKNVETELVKYFKLTNTGILKAFFYITTRLDLRLGNYLSKAQSVNFFSSDLEQHPLSLTRISLNNATDHTKGLVSIRLLDYNKAVYYLEKAKSVQYMYDDLSAADNVDSDYNKLNEANFPEGINKQELALYRRLSISQRLDVINILIALSNAYNNLSNYGAAIKYCKQARFLEGSGDGDQQALILNNLGGAYLKDSSYIEAIKSFEQAKILYEEKFGVEHPNVGEILSNMGLTYILSENFGKAIEFLEKANAIFQKKFGKSYVKVAGILMNLGIVHEKLAEYEEAIKYYNEAKVIFIKECGNEHPQVAMIYFNLGGIYNELAEYPQAINYCEKAKSIYEKIFGVEDLEIAKTLNTLGVIYRDSNNISKAAECYSQALSIYEKKSVTESAGLAMLLNNLGVISNDSGDYAEAIKYHKNAKTIYEKKFGSQNIEVAKTLNNLGNAYNNLMDYNKSLMYYKKTLAIYQEKFHTEHNQIASIISNIGWAYHKLGNQNEAIKYYQQALSTQEKILPDHRDTAQMLANLGEAYKAIGDYPQQIVYLKRALTIYENYNEDSSITFILNNLAKAYVITNQSGKAVECLQQTLNIYEKVAGKAHPDVISLETIQELQIPPSQAKPSDKKTEVADSQQRRIKATQVTKILSEITCKDFQIALNDDGESIDATHPIDSANNPERYAQLLTKRFGLPFSYIEVGNSSYYIILKNVDSREISALVMKRFGEK